MLALASLPLTQSKLIEKEIHSVMKKRWFGRKKKINWLFKSNDLSYFEMEIKMWTLIFNYQSIFKFSLGYVGITLLFTFRAINLFCLVSAFSVWGREGVGVYWRGLPLRNILKESARVAVQSHSVSLKIVAGWVRQDSSRKFRLENIFLLEFSFLSFCRQTKYSDTVFIYRTLLTILVGWRLKIEGWTILWQLIFGVSILDCFKKMDGKKMWICDWKEKELYT